MKPHGFPRCRRLADRCAIRAVFKEGRYHRLGVFQARTRASGRTETRYLVSIRKTVGSAPERNRLKRLVRESVRLNPLHLPIPHDICLFLTDRPGKPVGLADVQRDLHLLARRLAGSR